MRQFSTVVLTLALSAGLFYGCSEKKAPEQPKGAASAPVEATAQKQAQTPAAPEKAAAVKEEPSPAPSKAAATVEKVKATGKAVEQKAVTTGKAVETKAVAAVAVAEQKAAAAGKAVEEKAVAAEKSVEKALTPAPVAGDAATGATLYKVKCIACHGSEGKGTTMAPALKGNEWVKASTVADITGVIKNGRQGKAKKYVKFFADMPASKLMTESDLNSLAAYLKSLN